MPFGAEFKPRARVRGLVVERLPEETLVYDQERHRAHCLNPTAARIFELCDGRASVAEIGRGVERSLGAEIPEEAIWLGVRRLAAAHLLEQEVPEGRGISRRRALRTLGRAAAFALPLVSSILVPSGALAGMTCGAGTTVTRVQCQTGAAQFHWCCCSAPPKLCVPFGAGWDCRGASC